MLPQQYCLRWRYHHSNLQTMFSQLLERQAFCDVTLACEGQTLKAHKIVLSACSTYFDTILSQYEEKDPILIMKDVKFVDIKCLVEFMYKGEINVEHCHLATLLKTAEELRIKGLAEVSWREEESSNEQTLNGVHSILPPQVSMDNSQEPPNKRKRGRPPIDDYDQQFSSPKITNVTGNVKQDDNFSTNEMSNSDADASVWEEEQNNENTDTEYKTDSKYKTDVEDYVTPDDHSEPPSASTSSTEPKKTPPSTSGATNTQTQQSSSSSTSALDSQWPDVIKMNDYLNTGRRQQFWEEPFTKRVMDAIKNKDLEMKTAAELLGVSYGTLYGRYRDAYGCLKHPYRVRDFWTEQGPADILAKLQRKEITLFRAAEQLNVTPQTLSNYLLSLHQGADNHDMNSSHPSGYDGYEEGDSDEEPDHILPEPLVKPSSSARNNITAAVLHNHPDITIIKKEKKDEKMNNNSDHSEGISDDTDA